MEFIMSLFHTLPCETKPSYMIYPCKVENPFLFESCSSQKLPTEKTKKKGIFVSIICNPHFCKSFFSIEKRRKSCIIMGNQIVSWLCLTMAIASIACHHSVKGEASADDHMDSGTANDKATSAGDDVEHHDGGQRSGVEEAVVHERRGAYGGSDLHKKPPNTTSSGATNLPLTNLACCVFVCFLIASFTLG